MGHRRQKLSVSDLIAGQLIGHQHARHIPQALEQLAEKPFSRHCVTALRGVLILATLGLMGVAETFLLLAIAENVFGLHHAIRTLIYLKLSVSGHLTIFVTRTRGPLWSRPAPAPILLAAVIGTQTIATLIAV